MSETITVEGMSCEHCEQTVEEALEGVDGVTDVSVDREAETATVEGDADTGSLVAAVDDAGYEASA
ncbi:heavy-metal-associated domain-containing protein [Halobacteria archaeon HArc-gm2]|nr:heavy-metal-associated domain-containing protein [Halobacteria archaeon HArc-gm2]